MFVCPHMLSHCNPNSNVMKLGGRTFRGLEGGALMDGIHYKKRQENLPSAFPHVMIHRQEGPHLT